MPSTARPDGSVWEGGKERGGMRVTPMRSKGTGEGKQVEVIGEGTGGGNR